MALLWQSVADPPRAVSLLVYGLSMIELLAVSASYHLRTWRPSVRTTLRALDHASIFMLIAGTYAPIAFNVLAGWERVGVLVTIWALAAVGVTCSLLTPRLPRWVRAGLYLAMGWVALIPAPSLMRALPAVAVGGLVVGGLLYTVGALVYARRWPGPAAARVRVPRGVPSVRHRGGGDVRGNDLDLDRAVSTGLRAGA